MVARQAALRAAKRQKRAQKMPAQAQTLSLAHPALIASHLQTGKAVVEKTVTAECPMKEARAVENNLPPRSRHPPNLSSKIKSLLLPRKLQNLLKPKEKPLLLFSKKKRNTLTKRVKKCLKRKIAQMKKRLVITVITTAQKPLLRIDPNEPLNLTRWMIIFTTRKSGKPAHLNKLVSKARAKASSLSARGWDRKIHPIKKIKMMTQTKMSKKMKKKRRLLKR